MVVIKGRRRIVEKGASNSFWLYLGNGKPLGGFYDGSHHFDVPPCTRLGADVWYDVAVSFDNRFFATYVEGNFVGGEVFPVPIKPKQNGEPLIIGWKCEGIGLDYFAGMIRDLRIYARRLTDQEIYELHTERSPDETEPN